MWLMKGNNTATNTMNQQFHHFVEQQLSKVIEHENAAQSIRMNLESDSNVIDGSDLRSDKHNESRISTLRRTIIE
jgi:hypothetical protein